MPDIIKKFFDTFEIEPKEITDTHYLAMLAFLTCCDDEQYSWKNLSELRKNILEDIIYRYGFEASSYNDYSMKEIIQELFKGE